MSEGDEGLRSTYSDVLIGATHHGDEHVQENDDHDRAVHAEHQQADKHGERVLLVDLKCLQVDETERAPEERLQGFEQARTSDEGKASITRSCLDSLGEMLVNILGTVLVETAVLLTLVLLHACVVPEQLIEATGEGEDHEQDHHAELENVVHHAAERDLQWPEMRIDGEDVDQFQRAEDVRRSEDALGDQRGIPGVPVASANIVARGEADGIGRDIVMHTGRRLRGLNGTEFSLQVAFLSIDLKRKTWTSRDERQGETHFDIGHDSKHDRRHVQTIGDPIEQIPCVRLEG